MEIIGQFTVTDLVVLVTLAGGVLAGFQQGMLRYLLNGVVVIVAFILASQLKGPIADTIGSFWDFGSPNQQELWFFIGLFAVGVIGGFLLVRLFYRQTRLPIIRQIDEIGGAILGLLWVAILYSFSLVLLDSYFLTAPEAPTEAATVLGPIYEALNNSVILGWFRDVLVPILGFIVGPFIPDELEPFIRF